MHEAAVRLGIIYIIGQTNRYTSTIRTTLGGKKYRMTILDERVHKAEWKANRHGIDLYLLS